jgi:hypothetical protein
VPGDIVSWRGRVYLAPGVIAQSVPPDQNPSAPVNKTLSTIEGGGTRNFPAIPAWNGNLITLQPDNDSYQNPYYFDINPGGSVTLSKVSGRRYVPRSSIQD